MPLRHRLQLARRTILALLVLGAGATPAAAGSRPVQALYEASIAGLRVGEARISGEIDPAGAFAVETKARYKLLMWSGLANGRSTGEISKGAISASTYTVRTESKKERSALVAIERGNVVRSTIEPPLEIEGRVPLKAEHSRGVVDPIAGIIIGALHSAATPGSPCQGTLPVFTGWNRFDLTLLPAPRTAAMDGTIRGTVCEVRVTPLAGHKEKDSVASAMAKSRDIRVVFTGPDANGLLLPDRILVPLWLGTMTIVRKG